MERDNACTLILHGKRLTERPSNRRRHCLRTHLTQPYQQERASWYATFCHYLAYLDPPFAASLDLLRHRNLVGEARTRSYQVGPSLGRRKGSGTTAHRNDGDPGQCSSTDAHVTSDEPWKRDIPEQTQNARKAFRRAPTSLSS